MTHATDNQHLHACGGAILSGWEGSNTYEYCDKCRAFSCHSDVPDGTDWHANNNAWNDAEGQSPDGLSRAQRIGEELGNDGQNFVTADGCSALVLSFAARGRVTYRDGRGTLPMRCDFSDGSALVIAEGAWDYLAPECEGFCWDGVGCQCGEDQE